MNPELESSVRDVLTQTLAREDFPEVLVDPVSTYLVTGKAQHPGTARFVNFPSRFNSVYWLLVYMDKDRETDICYYLREVRQTFKLHDS